MTRGAAIFDLDRTLLSGASGPIITEHLRRGGILSNRSIPGEGAIYKIFDLVGENRPTMMLTRQAARAAAGWDQAAVRAAGEAAAEVLEGFVPQRARAEVERHRAEGRLLVMATTTPHDLIEPLAARLGLDAVVATRYQAVDGIYTGEIDGEFVWNRGKERAVRAWAVDSDVDLADSHAYSDSFYDVPLLSMVGHPHVINPDPRLAAYAAVRRWPVLHFDAPPGVPKLAGIEPQQVVLTLVRPELFPYARFELDGFDGLTVDGPALVVANHRSYFDVAAMILALARLDRRVRFLGKKELFDAPVIGPLARSLGGISVDRGSGSTGPLDAAAAALDAGELVAILPQGTIPRGREFFEPELKGRHGAARLALSADVPVLPIGLWGTEHVWPRSSRTPDMWNVVNPPTVTIRAGVLQRPQDGLGAGDVAEVTRRIMTSIRDLLPPEAQERHEPTDDELARTYPGGRVEPDPAAE